jgi:hypothetical protein
MKTNFTLLLLAIFLSPLVANSQLNNGGLYANFGVDADTRANYMKYGLVTGTVTSDDWFAPSGFGNNVIDTSNWATYLAQLQSGANIAFSERMSKLLYAKVSGKLWLDAAYGRDYTSAGSAKDSTVFAIASKNGQDPNTWNGTISSVPSKDDLIDVYAHMRRDGQTVYDSLWLFTGASIYAVTGSSYLDVELFKKNISYRASTGTFTSAGTAGGHSEWLFDASGNITQTGDLILAVTFNPGAPPAIDVRLWVSTNTYNTYYGGALAPKYFNFNANYSTMGGGYGYASIVSKAGTTAFGAGISNYSGISANDTTYATPWGTNSTITGWTPNYQMTQLSEIGLNLTRMGVDPALYSSTLNPCSTMFSDIFFASRSSASFTSDLKDFVGPLTFLRPPVMDFSLKGDTLRCNRPTGTITLTNNTTAAYYTWKTINGGNVTGANSDSSQLNVSKPGSYIVSASPALGCPATAVDTIMVPIDTFPPVASAVAGMTNYHIDLYGGNAAASNYPTPFGGSQGLTYNWTGPNAFASTIQNPVTDTVWGIYHLTVTEKRNGCTDTASATVLASMFTALQTKDIQLQGTYANGRVDLVWQDAAWHSGDIFTVENRNGQTGFQPIGKTTALSFTQTQPSSGNNLYRIKVRTAEGDTYYSAVITIGVGASPLFSAWLATGGSQSPTLITRCNNGAPAILVEYDLSGRIITKRTLALPAGTQQIPLNEIPKGSTRVLALYMNEQLVWCQQAVN